ncbi:putative T7SS-secreted protein [Nocardioides panacisoli]|uniref:Putative T7SS secretion signal domain-containing protein n=1 Tax=Nocardioides panacisoli TaxID=627624 RepID=A0ABP7J023_9ACTN
MYGDSDVIRKRVDQLRDQAADVRALADQLVARTEALGWTGRAADAMQVRVADRATHLWGAADRHDRGADALDRHAAAVDEAKEQISEAERRAASAGAEARDGFVPPAPGHKDWLSAELPGR